MALPLVAVVYLAVGQMAQTWRHYDMMSGIVVMTGALDTLGTTVHALQVERGLTAGFLGSKGGLNAAELKQARQETDRSLAQIARLESRMAELATPQLHRTLMQLTKSLSSLATMRQSVDDLVSSGADSFGYYTRTITEARQAERAMPLDAMPFATARAFLSLDHLENAKEAAGQERGMGNGFIAAGKMDPARFSTFVMMAGAQQASLSSFFALQSEAKAAADKERLDVVSRDVIDMRQALMAGGAAADLSALKAKAWFAATTQRINVMYEIERGLLQEAGQSARTDAAKAYRSLVVMVLVWSLAGVAILTISVLLGLSLVRPLKALTGWMAKLAEGDVSVHAISARKDEIGDMERAVEIFRLAAIRNQTLEAEAEQAREAAERERAEIQRLAEEEAERLLLQATGTLAEALQRLAAGDMMCDIEKPLAARFEGLRRDFNQSVRQLRETLLQVDGSVSAVDGGAQEVSAASGDLSQRSELQAASLEETAAALDEITANVASTSRRTAEARGVAHSASQQALRSGEIVGNAVSAMDRIEQSAEQITNIISVIDEIAFQTNLLALNAGVEAARAGEAGKGFAVVAQEVRELAQRSAKAAKEINALIRNSADAVKDGVKLVDETGEGLRMIGDLVKSFTGHMDAIAAATQEQSAGLAEVNSAINTMDQSTQKNAAMVEEMTAAAATLGRESSNLKQMVSRFTLLHNSLNQVGFKEKIMQQI
ncbi:methyl-accepting chemotaxis protein [Allorhizobium sonneratiae]|uniref:methyl-accepting chemotaxis protein n=1 Tax=Allorhizobium sonneratiae TaxID=2934936 RepID=UPI0020349933|nr:methyl-accepting chemotaxis protein [Allorhizobium sonneratiae]